MIGRTFWMPLPLARMGYSSETIIQDSVPGIQGRILGENKYIGPALQAGYINIILKSMPWIKLNTCCLQVPMKKKN
jgi:hypothetical protein